jgi:hypothetical protein
MEISVSMIIQVYCTNFYTSKLFIITLQSLFYSAQEIENFAQFIKAITAFILGHKYELFIDTPFHVWKFLFFMKIDNMCHALCRFCRWRMMTACTVLQGEVLMTHIESVCYFWGQLANTEVAQVVTTVTEGLASLHFTQAVAPLRADKVVVKVSYILVVIRDLQVQLKVDDGTFI